MRREVRQRALEIIMESLDHVFPDEGVVLLVLDDDSVSMARTANLDRDALANVLRQVAARVEMDELCDVN